MTTVVRSPTLELVNRIYESRSKRRGQLGPLPCSIRDLIKSTFFPLFYTSRFISAFKQGHLTGESPAPEVRKGPVTVGFSVVRLGVRESTMYSICSKKTTFQKFPERLNKTLRDRHSPTGRKRRWLYISSDPQLQR